MPDNRIAITSKEKKKEDESNDRFYSLDLAKHDYVLSGLTMANIRDKYKLRPSQYHYLRRVCASRKWKAEQEEVRRGIATKAAEAAKVDREGWVQGLCMFVEKNIKKLLSGQIKYRNLAELTNSIDTTIKLIQLLTDNPTESITLRERKQAIFALVNKLKKSI